MTPAAGKRRIAKLLGPAAAWRDYGILSSPEARAEGLEAGLAAKAEHVRLDAELDALRARLLDVPEYVDLLARVKAARKARETAFGRSRTYRLTVGKVAHGFFHVEAAGDNWADVVRTLEAKLEKSGGAK